MGIRHQYPQLTHTDLILPQIMGKHVSYDEIYLHSNS
ncbi:Uncharacterised protein [Yersinia enterocolitica]|nr:Uncharacterised protein [Yersinia mollaretii]CNK35223.1 Uncharacterised protein [Yersinia enterocolitica]CQQ75335.1 Uncharacterised protein [Yersinia mollaretii]